LTESEKFFSHVSIQTRIAGLFSDKGFTGNTLEELLQHLNCCTGWPEDSGGAAL
jgi:hypothetical protein